MPRVSMKPDTLNLENRKFEQKRLTRPLFINSVPKSGTHLLRNIVRMFVPVEQQYDIQFIQHPNLQEHLEAFNPDKCNLSWGHLLFFLSDEFSGNIDHVKGGRISVEELLNLMILGIYQKVPSMLDLYTHNAVAWLGTVDMMVKYEDLVDALKKLDTLESEVYFRNLLGKCGIDPVPDDWRERVKIGADRKQSGTARENLSGLPVTIPDELPDIQKKLIEYMAPGLRKLLGYE